MLNYDIKTYGCKVNTYDTSLLQKRMKAAGFLQVEDQSVGDSHVGDSHVGNSLADEPKIHILNTCAVTAEATKEALRAIRKLKTKDPRCVVVVTGCAAQVDTDKFSQLIGKDGTGADLVVANSHKGQLEELIVAHMRGELKEKVFKSNIFKKEDLEPGGGTESFHTRSFLKIQDGCNSFCTFCVIPFARGKSRSLSIDSMVKRVNEIYSNGGREVVLTGVHIGDYSDDSCYSGKGRLEDLVESLLLKTKMPRFRLSSLEPVELNDRLFDFYSDEHMCPHFHMSIQAANSKVLRDMKRQYSQKQVIWSLNEIQKRIPGAFVGMDVIAGFPGESGEEFDDTHNTLEALPWTRIHVFPYSPREGTFAMRLPGHMDRSLIMKRAARLRELSADRYAKEALEQVGQQKRVMVLGKPGTSGRIRQGLSRDYWPIAFKEPQELVNGMEIIVKVNGYDQSHSSRMEGCLSGEMLGEVSGFNNE